MSKRFFSRLAILSACALGAITAGCIAVGGTDHYTHPTLGRQLQDLKVARDTGAISDHEYADAKSKLIAGNYYRKR
ncbi:MAG: hypothetical protein H7Z14_01280 [Anaerolineae bacterium]|nr:hypothetical protein [Phycisphaerae bacterium]